MEKKKSGGGGGGAKMLARQRRRANPPDSLRVAARLDHGEGLRAAPVPEVQLVVGGNQQELSSRVKGQRGDGDIALREPALAPALQESAHHREGPATTAAPEGNTHVQVPDTNFTVKAPGGHQAGDGGVKGHTPGRSTVAH